MTRRRKFCAVAAVVLLTVAGCANVPLETKPQAIRADSAADAASGEGARPPDKDLSASDVVREFVLTNAQEADGYAASRQYLDPAAAKTWLPTERVTVIEDDFSTIPAPTDEQPEDPNETVVWLHGDQVGELAVDDSYLPKQEAIQYPVRLRKQKGTGEWRIVELPDAVITTSTQFSNYYFTTRLYYYAPNSNVLVPDLRYISAQPSEGLASRVMSALLKGPSFALEKAVDNPLATASIDTNVREVGSALEVPLTGIVGASKETRRRIVAQVVMSLENVDLVRLLSEGKPLLPDRFDWRRSDLDPATPDVADSDGYAVLGGKLVSLSNGRPTGGPAGSGEYQVESAAQSLEGGQLAVVERVGKNVRLRVGDLGKNGAPVDISGTRLTRPTWQPAYPGNSVSSEVWTVVDGKKVVRAQLTQDGAWVPRRVGTWALRDLERISALRLSRDGTRAAIIADGKLYVAAVVRTEERVDLSTARLLQPASRTEAVDVDWMSQHQLVVATSASSQPVVQISLDGYTTTAYNASNLELPINGITALPGGRVLVGDVNGVWTVSSTGEPWDSHRHSKDGMTSPLFPG